MKKGKLLNADLSAVLATMGHTDRITICDCGFPIHNDRRIDLALHKGVPTLVEVLTTILTELKVEKVILAEEIKTHSPELLSAIKTHLEKDVVLEFVSHSQLKELSKESVSCVRTGEATPYANIILCSGVTF